MKICLFISALSRGGAERVMINLAGYMQKKGWQVVMVNQYQKEDEYPLPAGIPRILSDITLEETTDSRIRNFIRRFRKLRGIWKKERPDVILSFIGKNNLMAILTSLGLHIPAAVSVRGEPIEECGSQRMKKITCMIYPLAAGVVLQTRHAMDFFPEKVRKRSVILKNPLNPDFLRPLYEGERDHVIYAVGRVDANKNHEMLIRAFAAVRQEFPDYKLCIYGGGELLEKLRGLVKELGLEKTISLPGPTSGVADAICRGSGFVLCSDSEGMPNTLIEAMCLGLPCISTDCKGGGPGELIRNGENGLLIPIHDQAAMEAALRTLMEDEAASLAMGKEAYKMQQEYEPSHVADTWMEFLAGLVR